MPDEDIKSMQWIPTRKTDVLVHAQMLKNGRALATSCPNLVSLHQKTTKTDANSLRTKIHEYELNELNELNIKRTIIWALHGAYDFATLGAI